MSSKQKIVVLRFSAMGDVAMVASVLREFVIQNPQVELIMVSRSTFEPFFSDINNLTFHSIEPKTKHKGIFGLYRLYKELQAYNPTAVADLHENLRSRILSAYFSIAGLKIERIDKGRAEKKALTRTQNKIFKPLRLTVERYADVFRAQGYQVTLSHQLLRNPKKIPNKLAELFADKSKLKIGISPFAQHIYKVYPLNKMEVVIAQLVKLNYELFIFGGGKQEQGVASKWSDKFKNLHNLIGNYSLTEELAIISNLDGMLTMDSAGMHMASLMGISAISIWGPTHPFAGFLGYGQLESNCIQIDNPIRPNSIYGNKPCLCGITPCIELIEPTVIVEKLKELKCLRNS